MSHDGQVKHQDTELAVNVSSSLGRGQLAESFHKIAAISASF